MSKEILLLENIEGLGREGDVVRVAEGYARNYLLPSGKAAPVNPATQRLLVKKRAERSERDAIEKDEAKRRAEKMTGVSCTIPMKITETGKLYGSVHEAQVIEALQSQGVELRKGELVLEKPIHTTGVFEVPIHLHPDVSTVLKIWIVEE